MHCANCDSENSDDSRFCKSCGRALPAPAAAAPDRGSDPGEPSADERVRALLERAYEARKDGDTAQAVMHCRDALRLQPNTAAAHALLVQLYETLGEHDLAIHAQQRVVELNPDSLADRIKLDDLRHTARQADLQPAPRFYAEARSVPGPVTWIGLAAVGAALMFVGGLFALQLQRREAPTTVMLPPNVRFTQETSSPTKAPSTPLSGAPTSSPPAQATDTTPYNPAFSFPPQILVEQVPYYPQGQRAQNPSMVMPVQVRAVATKPAGRATKSSKLLLPGDGGDGQEIIVKVADPKHGEPDPVIKVDTGPSSGTSASGPSSQDARSYMAMGDTQRVSGDFERAIASYKLALAGAGEEEGTVYQRIASCYQKKGDKDSAINNYKTAIGAYQRLIDAGRNVEDAKAGIRACESSIKTCNF